MFAAIDQFADLLLSDLRTKKCRWDSMLCNLLALIFAQSSVGPRENMFRVRRRRKF